MERVVALWRMSTATAAVMAAVGWAVWWVKGDAGLASIAVAAAATAIYIVTPRRREPSVSLVVGSAMWAGLGLSLLTLAKLIGEPTLVIFAGVLFAVALLIAACVIPAADEEPQPIHSGMRFFQALPLGLGTVLGGLAIVAYRWLLPPLRALRERQASRRTQPA